MSYFTLQGSMLQFRNIMPKSWNILSQFPKDLLEQLLINRGVITDDQKDKYFNPKIKDYPQDIDIPNIDKAQKRISQAIQDSQLIVVYGDYDVDGICASAILYHGLTSIGAKVLPYIPHREKEGYGLSRVGLDAVKTKGASLVISVDCGIVALDQADYAKELGLDLIITDHHQPSDKLPQALTIVHSTGMCGAAVAWCLIQDQINSELRTELLELVAIATVCDMIPLIGINRAFVTLGLKQLNSTKNIGLKALINECSIKVAKLGVFEIGFLIGPRLNAIGRIEDALPALRLLCTKDKVKASELARILCQANDHRKQLTLDGMNLAKEMVSVENDRVLILNSPVWVPGIIGLIAGRITEEFGISTIVISEGDEVSKGSARAVKGLNITEVIRTQSPLLLNVGGHEGAAGFSLETKNISQFKDGLLAMDYQKYPTIEPTIDIDAQVSLKDINKQLISDIEKLQPCGLGNLEVLLAATAVRVDDLRQVGSGKHLQLTVDGVKAIGFGMGDKFDLIQKGQLINIAFTPSINEFNGNLSIQLQLKDIQFS